MFQARSGYAGRNDDAKHVEIKIISEIFTSGAPGSAPFLLACADSAGAFIYWQVGATTLPDAGGEQPIRLSIVPNRGLSLTANVWCWAHHIFPAITMEISSKTAAWKPPSMKYPLVESRTRIASGFNKLLAERPISRH